MEDCSSDSDADGIYDDVDDCVGAYDECGICNGPGASMLADVQMLQGFAIVTECEDVCESVEGWILGARPCLQLRQRGLGKTVLVSIKRCKNRPDRNYDARHPSRRLLLDLMSAYAVVTAFPKAIVTWGNVRTVGVCAETSLHRVHLRVANTT